MRQAFDGILKVRVPKALTQRLQQTADRYARLPSDVTREAIAIHLDRLAAGFDLGRGDTDGKSRRIAG